MGNMNIVSASMSDIGHRQENEDSFLVLSGDTLGGICDGIYIIADGMGGRTSGATASKLAIDTIKERLLKEIASGSDIDEVLKKALKAANIAVYNRSQTDPALNGMGTTCVAAVINNGKLYYAHLGDSRAYLFRNGKLLLLTEDHSFVAEKIKSGEMTEEEARKSRFRNIITKAIGIEEDVEPDIGAMDLQPGDMLMLCSDGLSTPLDTAMIEDILIATDQTNVEDACRKLIEAALENGGKDNITVILAVYGKSVMSSKTLDNRTRADSPSSVKPTAQRGSWLLFTIMGIIIGLVIGVLCTSAFIEKSPTRTLPSAHKIQKPKTDYLQYEDPIPLLGTKVQGGILAIDKEGIIYLADQFGQIIKFDKQNEDVITIPAKPSLVPRTANNPAYMAALDSNGDIYISDIVSKLIIKYQRNGVLKQVIAAGKLLKPQAIAVDDDGSIYVIDANQLKVIKPEMQAAD